MDDKDHMVLLCLRGKRDPKVRTVKNFVSPSHSVYWTSTINGMMALCPQGTKTSLWLICWHPEQITFPGETVDACFHKLIYSKGNCLPFLSSRLFYRMTFAELCHPIFVLLEVSNKAATLRKGQYMITSFKNCLFVPVSSQTFFSHCNSS